MVDLSHQQLLDLTAAWYWMVSDRVGQFDDTLRRPMKNLEIFHSATPRAGRGVKENITPGTPTLPRPGRGTGGEGLRS